MIITSQKGKEMLKTVSPIYYQSRIMQSIFQSIGTEWDSMEMVSSDILLQLFPQTATWGLRYWEELLKIPVNKTVSIERRRALVMTRIKLRSPMTPERIANVIGSLTKGQSEYVEVIENIEPNVFMVTIGTENSGIDYLDVFRTLKRIKPSHESFYLGNSYLRTFSLSKRRIYGFSKIIHAIGTFVCSKDDVGFMATEGHRNTGDIVVDRNALYGTADPLVCSKDLKYTILGFLNDDFINENNSTKRGNSKPLACSKNLKFTRIEVV